MTAAKVSVKSYSAKVSLNKMQIGYKKTEIGILPEDWNALNLASIGNIIRGASPRPKGDPKYYGGHIPRLMVEDVTRDGKYVTPTIDYLTEEGAKKSRPCKAGTLTVVCSGTVGIPSFLAVDACIHDGFLALINISEKVDCDYLYHYLVTQKENFDKSATHGGIFTNLTTKSLSDFKVALPFRIIEQQKISEILSNCDALISTQEKLIAKKRNIKLAIMQQLLTGITRLPNFNTKWENKQLGQICKITKGQLITEKDAIHGSVPVIGGGKEPSYYHNFANRMPPVITISASGASAGFVSIHYTSIFASDCSTIESSQDYSINFIYYFLFLMQYRIYTMQTGGAQPHIHAKDIAPITIPLPCLKEQSTIATILIEMDAEISLLQEQLEKIKAIKQGMMQELLTGRIRLI